MKLLPNSDELIFLDVKSWRGDRVWWRYRGTVRFLTTIVEYLREGNGI